MLANKKIDSKPKRIKNKTYNSSIRSKSLSPRGYKTIRSQCFINKAIRAARDHKIFTIHYHGQSRIRTILRNRGWVEKCSPRYLQQLQQLSDHKININAKPGNDYEIIAMSRACKSISPNFVWHPSSFQNVSGMPYRNRIQRSQRFNFTSKDGLLGCIENSYWYTINNISEIRSPRYHRLSVNDERIEFLKDYRTTYCLSLLKFICEENEPINLFNNIANLPITLIDFALTRVQTDITYMLNEDDTLDFDNNNNDDINNNDNNNLEWNTFYTNIDNLINRKEKFKINNINEALNAITKCQELHNVAKLYWPTLSSDGYNNLWILKPSYWCRGNGIVIKKNYTDIINFVNKRKNIRYIVQKYIERPLLIHKVKFDIRQYILLSITNNNFNIWMYKNCYLRFSSQEYQLNNLQQSIHITNNAIQRRYRNGKRSDKLPPHNMWSLDEFKNYLININEPDIWDNRIYPSMKKNIMAVVLTSLEETDIIPNAFEIYGADFMIDENYESMLLEINANPDMSCSTKVTGKICPAAISDLIKVILDYPKNINSNTGNFELIHSIEYNKIQTINNLQYNEMIVNGKTIKLLPQPPEIKIQKKKLINNQLTNNNNGGGIVNTIKYHIKNNNIKQIQNKIKNLIKNDKSKNTNINNNNNVDENIFKLIDNNNNNNNITNTNNTKNQEKKFLIKIVNSINNYENNNSENVEKILKNIENSLMTTEKNSNKIENNCKTIENNLLISTNNHNNINSINTNNNNNSNNGSLKNLTNLTNIKQIYPIFLNKGYNNINNINNNNKTLYNNKNYQFKKYQQYIINKPPSQNEHEIIISKESFMKLIRNDNNSLVPIIPLSMFNNMDIKKPNIINGNLKIRLTSDLKEAFTLGALEQLSS